ncbi:competence protein ComGC [Pilibacter termitis]|uniref:Competence protein ComGC n=2 Tax=Pilibacter termitis TaxID=263852 RepID=A0A1T4RGF5_9ENTE|nr:competence protein ComGC [Pilibacter termitis]
MKLLEKLKGKRTKAFTLLETLIVIILIAALILLFSPKLIEQKDVALKKSDKALALVVREQYELYQMEKGSSAGKVTGKKLSQAQIDALFNEHYISQKQKEQYEKIPESEID